jgi:2Fe-2S ferredoxin
MVAPAAGAQRFAACMIELPRMARVTVLPNNIEFEADSGETVMAAATSSGLYWPTTCGGQGICTTCLTEVVSGGEHLLEMGRAERKTLVAERGDAVLKLPVRLACQTVIINGPVVVKKAGVRPAEASL